MINITKGKDHKIIILLPVFTLIISILLHVFMPNKQMVFSCNNYTVFLGCIGAFYLIYFLAACLSPKCQKRLVHHAPLAAAGLITLTAFELITLKLNLLPLPFFPSPVKIFEAFIKDGKILLVSVLYSLRLLFAGYFLGVLLGLPSGILMGWYVKFRYWMNPIVRIIGPVPITAWIPIAMVAFPTSFSASVFLIALTTWFPVTVMTWSGVSNVNNSYFNIAKTLGAKERYLIFKIALPAALPLIFIGLFMGMGTAFVALTVAEIMGAKAGLGWYIQWAQGLGEYYKLYASLVVSAILFSTLISLLFKIRDKMLAWQNGLIKW